MRKFHYVFNGILALVFLAIGGWLYFMGQPWVWLGAMALSAFHIHTFRIEVEARRMDVLQSTLLKLLKEKHDR